MLVKVRYTLVSMAVFAVAGVLLVPIGLWLLAFYIADRLGYVDWDKPLA